jgi:hypothetical protein
MSAQLNTPDTEPPAEQTPEVAHYQGLFDAFVATVEEIGADKLSRREVSVLKEKLASQYYALTACDIHAGRPSTS